MGKTCRYGFGTEVTLGFEPTLAKLEQLLTGRGFQVTGRLRMDDLLNGQAGEPFRRYAILGACHPQYASVLFRADPDIGLVMPCKLVVYELEAGGCRVMVKDPARIMDLIDSPLAIEASIKIKEELEEVIEAMRPR